MTERRTGIIVIRIILLVMLLNGFHVCFGIYRKGIIRTGQTTKCQNQEGHYNSEKFHWMQK
jgi:hypothetical protein